jgi:HlyD family secretion protein
LQLITSKKRAIALALAGVVVLALVLGGLGGADASKGEAERAEPSTTAAEPTAVATVLAVERPVSATLRATGSLVADEAADVAPQTSGQVVDTPVRAGDRVAAGSVLARLDDRDARARLERALATAQQAETAVAQARARIGLGNGATFDPNQVPEVRSAYHEYQVALAQQRDAEANEKRYEALVEAGVVSQQQYEQYRTQANTARAQAAAARERYETAKNGAGGNNESIASAEAALRAARADVVLARKAVDDTVIRAPFSGFVGDRPI